MITDYGKALQTIPAISWKKGRRGNSAFEAINPDATDFSAVVRKAAQRKARHHCLWRLSACRFRACAADAPQSREDALHGPDGVKDETFLKTGATPKAYMPPIPATQAVLKNTRKPARPI